MKRLLIIMSVLFIGTGCAKKDDWLPVGGEKVETIEATLINTDGNKIGDVRIFEEADGVTIDVFAEGLPPGKKGIHIHEIGECTPPDFKSAGAHLNPFHKEHGFENPKGYHLGDLPNIEIATDGTVNVSLTLSEITLKRDAENTILGKQGSAIVIHEQADDYKTDPAGNAGERIACAAVNG